MDDRITDVALAATTRAVAYEMVASAIMSGMDPSALLGTYHQNLERHTEVHPDVAGVLTLAQALSDPNANPAAVLLATLDLGRDAAERTFVEAAAHCEDPNGQAIMLASAANHLRARQETMSQKTRLI